MAAAKRNQQTTFARVPIGGHFYTGVGFWVKRSETSADYFGLSQKYNEYDKPQPPERVVFVEATK